MDPETRRHVTSRYSEASLVLTTVLEEQNDLTIIDSERDHVFKSQHT